MLDPSETRSRFAVKSCAAFSLIELMIVVAILGALVSIIIPSFSYSEQRAKDDVTVSEMRQLRHAFVDFYSDNYPSDEHLEALTRYGLWPLFSTNAVPVDLAPVIHAMGTYDAGNRLGWRGPYALMEKNNQAVYPQNGQLKDSREGTVSGSTIAVPVALDPYGGYYRVMSPTASPAQLYLVCTGPDRILQTVPTATDDYGYLVAAGDDIVLPLRKL